MIWGGESRRLRKNTFFERENRRIIATEADLKIFERAYRGS